ncbi:MAG: ATP-binding protein [Simkania negevensis]|nr:ATP-binding protein [Simkania negevensis]
MKTESKTFKAEPSSLSAILNWAREKLEENEIVHFSKIKLELAFEEGLVNILTHGKQKAGTEITVTYRFSAKEYFEWELIDEGTPFNPLLHRVKKQEDLPLEEREEGGLGVYFIKQTMDLVDYKREGDKNCLTLRKYLNEG